MTFESIYKKYNLSIDGKKTFLYALKSLSLEEAKIFSSNFNLSECKFSISFLCGPLDGKNFGK